MSIPRLRSVDSTCVARMGYDARIEEAYVEFHDARTYAYRGVPAHVFDEFARAGSKGSFLNEVIKPRYPARRL